ncbi:protocadherin Fat 4 isoform X2 [Amia ocellicauda]|uniref:protocadherin Fat 4 isoform X2 n=1 Tax=Amia ocellicauda TaxID=2972642 RepID=UPI00346446BA
MCRTMGTLNFSHLLFFMLIGNYCFYKARGTSVGTTRINCQIGGNVQLETKPDEYDGVIETITDVPTDTGLEIIDSFFSGHAKYVELVHTPGSADAIVQTKGPLDGDKIQPGGELYYNIRCLNTLRNNTRRLPILDINDNNPVFQKRNYNVSVSETISVGSSILKVTAVDLDISSEFNSITYTVVPPHPSEFEVRVGDGSILLKQTLNYNRASSYSFTVKAQDRDGNSDQTDVFITVEDGDNMSPYFIHGLYDAAIPEHKTGIIPTILPEPIEARDGDLGLNVPVDYSISGVRPANYTDFFIINTGSGILSVVSELDREIVESVTINIQASQRDDALKTADATVVVKIEDVNDNEPTFDQTSYIVSIPENCPNDTTILRVTVTDLDQGGFRGELRIIPDSSPFTITNDGSIKVKDSSILDREITSQFSLQIEALENMTPNHKADVNLIVNLLDENDNSPSFGSSKYVGKIFLNQTVGMTVVKVEAQDPDQGANSQVKYAIQGGNQENYFEINQDTGEITLLKEIAFVENRVFQFFLYVTATDGGVVPRVSSVLVDILAPGESKPQFLKPTYEGTVQEEQDAPVRIVQVGFLTLDPIVSVQLTVVTEPEKFEIDENGIVTTKVRLDYDTQENYTITISITDGTTVDNAVVIVKVTDINDNDPVFTGSYPDVQITEDAKNGTEVAQMSATDIDKDFNAEIMYILQGGDGKFDIDPVSGLITLAKELDRETLSKYKLTVTARDHGQPSRFATITFAVHVDDVNDNPPVFSLDKYVIKIAEDLKVGMEVLNVSAVDLDDGANSVVEYSITGQTPASNPAIFSVNPATGLLSLNQPLDFETVQQYTLTVEARDGGSPQLQSTCSVIVQVLDVNDNAPQFSKGEYSIAVFENLPSGAAVLTVNVIDRDQDGFSNGHFILNSNTFNINKLGTVALNSNASLDWEQTSNYVLMVEAVDTETNGLSATAVVNITILDINDNNPQFKTLPQNISIPEGDYTPDSPGEITRIVATDSDAGENGHVTLSILSADPNALFHFREDGTLIATGHLDRESKDLYELVIVASDNGIPQRTNITDIKISITDINDNAPEFSKSSYSGSVLVPTATEGDVVLVLAALDPDIGNNSLITYSFSNNSPLLHLDGDTGVITLATDLATVTEDTLLQLTAVAKDHGQVPRSSTAMVLINLMIDDPVSNILFESSNYNFSIAENQLVNTKVGTVKAVTGSLLVHVNYTINSKSSPDFFIDTQGNIVTLQALDREQQSLHTLAVEAVDSRSPPNTAITVVTVQVEDMNDNRPEFSPLMQTQLLALEGRDNIELGYFTATDQDLGENAEIVYSLPEDFGGIFTVNSSTGRLLITQALDRETQDRYLVTVKATDAGNPPQSSSVTLNITVQDANDCRPVFNQTSYEVSVKESEPPGVVLTVFATDDDIGYNAIVNYAIVRNPIDPFYIGENTGRIGIFQALDYEKKALHTFTVKAFNPGSDMENTVNVTVKVEDVNEEAPIFDNPPYNVYLEDNSVAGQLVIDINATHGNKPNDLEIHYNITEGNEEGLFAVSPTTGKITLTSDLTSTTEVVEYSLTIMATDSGTPQLSAIAKVTILKIPSNVQRPVFSKAQYKPEPLSERAAPGTLVMEVSAFYHSKVVYSIENGNNQNYFSMDGNSGVIKTKKDLNVDNFPALLRIRATDSGKPLVFGEADVNVTVVDENDFPPVFPNSSYTVFLDEEESAPTLLIQLNATDEDSGRNGDLHYAILSGDENAFRLDAVTGCLYATVSFDYETGPVQYQIVVYAEDDGVPQKKREFCTVFLHITDINDMDPVFEPVPALAVSESAKEGDLVGKVKATDKDMGDNAFIAYNITDGGEDFSIDDEGAITVRRPVNYEQQTEFLITVTATNNKTAPFRQAATDLTISVLDVNDNPPVFTKSNYTASLNLTSPARTFVTSVSATDQDSGSNAVVEYYVLDEDPDSKYFIIEDLRKGAILTKQSLPRPGSYRFSVEARDRGDPPLNSTASVFVDVIDNGMFVPEFNSSEISERVEENTGSGHLVYTFSVLDTPGVSVNYSIINGNELDHFRLNANTGELYTTINLDFEQLSKYIITVEAIGFPSTKSSPAAKNIARLTIVVEDVNEAPEFSSPSYSARIFKVSPYKTPVVKVKATDPDSGEKGLPVYSLNEPKSKEFDVDSSTGQVYVVSLKSGTFTFQVNATDLEGKGLSAVTSVEVIVEESSYNDVVVISINVAVPKVEKKISEVQKALGESLAWNIHIIEVNGISRQTRSTESSEESYISIIASNTDYKIISAVEVKRKLQATNENINNDLKAIFGDGVSFSVKDNLNEAPQQDPTVVIVLSVLLAVTVISFLVFVVINILRNRKLKSHSENSDKASLCSSDTGNKKQTFSVGMTDIFTSQKQSDNVSEQIPPAQRRNSKGTVPNLNEDQSNSNGHTLPV